MLLDIYHRLLACYGAQHWWPANEPFEVMVGAILTQSAAWVNVEKGIAGLRAAGAMSPAALRALPLDRLADLVHPCGYFNAKARKLKALAEWLDRECGDSLDSLFARSAAVLRRQLLSVHGIGPETADSIVLYAAGKPAFVIDAYTRRIMGRLGIAPEDSTYEALQALFMSRLPQETRLFNEYHALLVNHGKTACSRLPRCAPCCLKDMCRYAAVSGVSTCP